MNYGAGRTLPPAIGQHFEQELAPHPQRGRLQEDRHWQYSLRESQKP